MAREIIDKMTGQQCVTDFAHHQIHEGRSFSVSYAVNTDSNDLNKTGIYLKTPAAINKFYYHMVATFSASDAANFVICEGTDGTVLFTAADGTGGVAIYNRNRASSGTSGVRDNEATPGVGVVTTLMEDDWANYDEDTVLAIGPIPAGSGPFAAGGVSRSTQEWVLAANMQYVFYIINVGASANKHIVELDWYEHKNNPNFEF